MSKIRITALRPVRYAFWPAMPTRRVGTLLRPEDKPLELSEKQYRDIRLVATEPEVESPIQVETIGR